MSRRKLLQSFLSLAALAFTNPMKLLASCDPSETKEIKIDTRYDSSLELEGGGGTTIRTSASRDENSVIEL